MAFGRGKDVKKSSYYVWFLGAKEATGLRGEEYILPVLHKLLDQEKHFEPSKVTLQVSNKGIKIIQNVPKKKGNSKAISMAHLPSSVSNQFNYNASSRHCTLNSSASSSSSTNSLGGGGFIGGPSGDHHHHSHHHHASNLHRPNHNQSAMSSSSGLLGSSGYLPPGCKMEQIKHLIPHDSITSVVQEDDIVCCLLLIYNPLTQCPIHVHAYRCDSIETAYSLTEQIQVLIERPENQKKFASIEKKLAMKAIIPSTIAHTSMHNSTKNYSPSHLPHHLIYPGTNQQQQLLPVHHKLSSSSSSSPSHRHQHRLLQSHHSSSASCSPARRSHISSSTGAGSDGRSTRTEGSDELTSTLRDDRSRPSRSLERVNRADIPLTGALCGKQQQSSQRMINGHVHPSIHPHYIEPDKEQLFESLAHELKVKLGNHKQTGPILLPPRDYDTISRCRGKLDGIEERESTNRHIVGIIAGKKRISKSCKSLNGVTDANDINEEDEALPDTPGDLDNYTGKPYKSMNNIINGKKSTNKMQVDEHEQRSPVLSTSKSFASSGIGSDEALQDSHRSSKVTSSTGKSYKYSNCSNGTSTESSDSLEEDDKVKPISDSSSWLNRSKSSSKTPVTSAMVKDRTNASNNNYNKHEIIHHRENSSTSDFISLPPSIAPARSQVKSNFLFGDLPSNLSSQPPISSKVSKVTSVNGSSSHSINAMIKPKLTENNAQEKPKFYFPAESSFNSQQVQDKRKLLNKVSPSNKLDSPVTIEDECEFIKKSSELRKNRESKNNQLSVKVTITGDSTSVTSDGHKVYNSSSISSGQVGSNYLCKKISSLNGINSTSSSDGKRLTSTSCYGTVILDTNLMKR